MAPSKKSGGVAKKGDLFKQSQASVATMTPPPVGTTTLQFKKHLIASSKAQNSAPELTKRLKSLHQELSSADQDNFEANSLSNVSKELLSSQLINSMDAGVKALTACCLVDVLRLYAPNCPFTSTEQDIIFRAFLSQLKLLGDDKKGYAHYYNYILVSLSTVKSIVLVAELDSEQLLVDYFKVIYQVVEAKAAKDDNIKLLDILEQLLLESKTVPHEIINIILDSFSPKKQIEKPGIYSLSRSLCISAASQLQGPVCQYFTDIITSGSNDDQDQGSGMLAIEQAHQMIHSLNRIVPQILLSVIPQLEAELTVEKLELRLLAINTLGPMLAAPGSPLPSKYPSVWKGWLQRRFDKSPLVRAAWVGQCSQFYSSNPSLIPFINNGLKDKLLDNDEKVRLAVCESIGGLEYNLIKSYLPLDLLQSLSFRIRDKKLPVKMEAFKQLSKLYQQGYDDLVRNDEVVKMKLAWIPTTILESIYTDDNDTMSLAESTFRLGIVKLSSEVDSQCDRLLTVISSLSDKAYKGFLVLLQRQQSLSKDFALFVKTCRKIGGEITDYTENDEQLYTLCSLLAERLTSKMPKRLNGSEYLVTYPRANDKKLNAMFDMIMNPIKPIGELKRIEIEALKRIQQVAPNLKDVFVELLTKLSPGLAHQSFLPILLEFSIKASRLGKRGGKYNGDKNKLLAAQKFVKDLTEIYPSVYEHHLKDLSDLIVDGASNSEEWLKALSKYAQMDDAPLSPNRELAEKLSQYVLSGTVNQAQYAAEALARFEGCEELVDSTITTIVEELSLDDVHLPARLDGLAHLTVTHSHCVEDHIEPILNFLLKQLLMGNNDLEDPDVLLTKLEELPSIIQAKLFGISVLVNRAVAYAEDPTKYRLAQPVFNLLWALLDKGGEIVEDKSTPTIFRSHLRLKAATSILELAGYHRYASFIPASKFNVLASVIQDEFFHVRYKFGAELMDRLRRQKLPTKFATILFYAAYDVEVEFKSQIKSFIKNTLTASKIGEKSAQLVELTVVRLLHLLSHDKEFSSSPQDLLVFSKYIEFFLGSLATQDNISFIYSVVTRVKLVQDIVDPPQTEYLYILSDLTTHIITKQKTAHNWFITPYPGTIQLPQELFKPLAQNPDAVDLAQKSYLPPEFLDESQHYMVPPSQFQKKLTTNPTPRAKSAKHIQHKPANLPGPSDTDEDEDPANKGKKNKANSTNTTPNVRSKRVKLGDKAKASK